MRMPFAQSALRGQTSLEYLLLLTVVAVIVMASFRTGSLVDQVQKAAGGYYNTVSSVIMDSDGYRIVSGVQVDKDTPAPINGGWCPITCPPAGSYGFNIMYRSCECPAPAFGGLSCSDPMNPNRSSCGSASVQSCNAATGQVTCNGVNSCGTCPVGQICVQGGCICPNSLSCPSIITGSIPDASCSQCICPEYTYLSGNGCQTCPPYYSYNGTKCVPLTCGVNQVINATGTGCWCDAGSYVSVSTGQCTFCPIGKYWNTNDVPPQCDSCQAGEIFGPPSPYTTANCVAPACTPTCHTPSCGANMIFDFNPTDPGYYTCQCDEGPLTNFEYDPTTKGCIKTGNCPVTVPENSSVCPNTKYPTSPYPSSGGSWSLVAGIANCTGTTNCQAYCNTGVVSSDGLSCVSSNCPASLPAGSVPCKPPSTAPIPVGQQWNLVYTCDNSQPCEAICDPSKQMGLVPDDPNAPNNQTLSCQSLYMCPDSTLPDTLTTNYVPCPTSIDPYNAPPKVPFGTSKWIKVDQETCDPEFPNNTCCDSTTPCEAYKVTLPSACAAGTCPVVNGVTFTCGEDTCKNTNGCGACPQGESCDTTAGDATYGKCKCVTPGICPIGNNCGPDTCGNPNGVDAKGNPTGCNGANPCTGNLKCISGQCECVPGTGCSGKTCGLDACGNQSGCGPCAIGYACNSDQTQCVVCPHKGVCPTNAVGTPNQCGYDTCGFANGCNGASACPSYEKCDTSVGDVNYGQCVCQPQPPCGSTSCGMDSCGKYCPVTCSSGTVCNTALGEPGTACICNTDSCPNGTCYNENCYCQQTTEGSTACPTILPQTMNNTNGVKVTCPLGCHGSYTASCSATGGWTNVTGSCSANQCKGTVPSSWHAVACTNNVAPINTTTSYVLAPACLNTSSCQAVCSSPNYVYSASTQSCVPACIGTPLNGTACGNNLNPPTASVGYTMVATCPTTPANCRGTCTSGYTAVSGVCQANVCSNLKTGWTPCGNNTTPPTTAASYSLVATCPTTSANCQATCGTGYTYNSTSKSCVANTCTGLSSTWAACGNNTTPPTSSGTYSVVQTCPATPANCQAICGTNYSYLSGTCEKQCLRNTGVGVNNSTATFPLTNAGADATGTCNVGSGTAKATCNATTGVFGTISGICCAANYDWNGTACEKQCLKNTVVGVNNSTATFPLTNAGADATGTCNAGSGSATATCNATTGVFGTISGTCCAANYDWNGTACEKQCLKNTGVPVNNSTATFPLTNAGVQASGTCNVGSGTATATCNATTGVWGTISGTCCAANYDWNGTTCVKQCVKNAGIGVNNTTATFPLTNAGALATGTCNYGSGTASATCNATTGAWGTATGTCCAANYDWNGTTCVKQCVKNAGIGVNNTTATFPLTNAGALATGTCNAGSGTATATCNATTGVWGTASGTCCAANYDWNGTVCEKQCPRNTGAGVNNTTATFPLTDAGAQATGTCNVGSGSATATCNATTGVWGTASGTCCAANYDWNGTTCVKQCLKNAGIGVNNSTATFPITNAGALATGTCNVGSGTATATCNATTGVWGTASGTCCAANYDWNGTACEKQCLRSISVGVNNTTATFPTTNSGALATGTCNVGSGSATATCNATTGAWGKGTGTCCAAGYIWTGTEFGCTKA